MTKTDETRDALVHELRARERGWQRCKEEILHWLRACAADDPDEVHIGTSTPLCQRYWGGGSCEAENGELCPVHAATGARCCSGIGFSDAEQALYAWADKPEDQSAREAWKQEALRVVSTLQRIQP